VTRRVTRRARTALRVVLGIVAASSFLGGVPSPGAPSAAAQTATSLGGVQGRAAASGLYAIYAPVGLLPISPLAEIGAPDALATMASGPTTFARASVLDPGDILANPDAVLALASPDYPAGSIPPYPYRVSATSGVGEPTAESNPAPGLNARVAVDATGSSARANLPRFDAPAFATTGTIKSTATTKNDGATATMTARTVISDLNVLGILVIDSIVTDVKATSMGVETKLEGGTTVTGASVLGRPVRIGAEGIEGTSGGLNDVLERAGIHVTLAAPIAQAGGTSGQLASTGLRIDLELSERTVPAITALTALVPPLESPIPGAPSVEDLVAAARARHLVTIELGRASVALTARPAIVFGTPAAPAVTPRRPVRAAPVPAQPSALVGAPSVPLAPAPVVSPGAPTVPTATSDVPQTTFAAGIGALVLLALLAQPFAGNRLARLASAILADDAGACPREKR
jgi:hypothetical protein